VRRGKNERDDITHVQACKIQKDTGRHEVDLWNPGIGGKVKIDYCIIVPYPMKLEDRERPP